jgi:D-glycero-D-manno-heptose 1,7-bisphosphate phosphatase
MTPDPPIRAVLFDRDGTLIVDVPYNGDPALVEPVPSAAAAIGRLREAGVAVGVVSNQSGIARGLITREQVIAVNRRVDELLGPFDVWRFCPHGEAEGCGCRKPQPGLVTEACRILGVGPEEAVVIGDIGADVSAAAAAGARSVIVPTPQTRAEEVAAAPLVAAGLAEAVDLVLAGVPAPEPVPEARS